MPPPLFGISPGLSVLPTHSVSKKRPRNMAIKHRRHHTRKSRSHLIGRSKSGGRARKRKHRRRRHRKTRSILPSHPSLFT